MQSVAVERSEGALDTSGVCVALVEGSGSAPIAVDSSHTTAGGTSACFADNSSDEDMRVQVSVQRDDRIEWLLGASEVTVVSQSIAKFEE